MKDAIKMSSTISSQTRDCSSSEATVESVRSDAVLALGKALVSELGYDQSVDTLSRWMAHYLAELIEKAESASVDEKAQRLCECFRAVSELWQHRNMLPDGRRPFEDFEPILRALESLDPDDETPRYFRSVRPDEPKSEQEMEARKWLDLAAGADFSAKMLIRYCLSQAAQNAMDKSQEWVRLAADAGIHGGGESIVIRFTAAELEPPNERERKELEDKISRIDGFVAAATGLADALRAQLAELENSSPAP